jgi:hypothetical protein
VCRDGIATFSCDCDPGYTGSICNIQVMECHSLPCQNRGRCIDLVNKYQCNCLPGTSGERSERMWNIFRISLFLGYKNVRNKEETSAITECLGKQKNSHTLCGVDGASLSAIYLWNFGLDSRPWLISSLWNCRRPWLNWCLLCISNWPFNCYSLSAVSPKALCCAPVNLKHQQLLLYSVE